MNMDDAFQRLWARRAEFKTNVNEEKVREALCASHGNFGIALASLKEAANEEEAEPTPRVIVVSGGGQTCPGLQRTVSYPNPNPAASGIGAACVAAFLSGGDIVWSLDVAASPADAGFRSKQVDISNVESTRRAVAEILEVEGRIDALVVSAGVHHSGTIEDVTEADYDRVMGINFKGSASKRPLPM